MDKETNENNSQQNNNEIEQNKDWEQHIPSEKSAFSLYEEDSDDEVSIFKVKSQEILKKITQNLVTTFSDCNPDFNYELNANPRRVLTKPSKAVHNDGYDNENWDYILYVNDILGGQEGQQYQILDILGKGTFGQVVKCQNVKTKEIVALKVIKNKPAYYNQSLVEVAILDILNNQYDKEDKHNIIRLKDTFIFRGHLCIIFEMLSYNLYELIKQNQFRGLSTNLVRLFVSQLLDALCVLNKSKIIHCDLKPENILLKNLESPAIKVIDFGSACHENQTTYTYIQSRFYRSIEVLLGLPYTSSIDMWSLGCIAAELYLGLPLFPGSSEYNQVSRIVNMLGMPPLYTIEKGKNAHKYFKKVGVRPDGKAVYQLKSMEEFMEENNTTEQPSKIYFNGDTLDEIINLYPITRKGLKQREIDKEMQNRTVFIDFLHGLLNLNPLERWSPQEARYHPFITGEKYVGPYVPSTRIKSIPMSLSLNSYSNNPSASNASTPINITTKSNTNTRRPRANTISSSRVQNVPPQLQRLAAFNPQNNNNNVNSNYYSNNGPTQYQIIQQQSLSEMANLENVSSTMNAATGNSRLSALLNTNNGYLNTNDPTQSSQLPNQQMLVMNNQSTMNVQNDSQYLNNIFSDMHIDPSLYNVNINPPLSSSLDNLSSTNQRRMRNRRLDYNISTKHFRRQSFGGSSLSYHNSINNTRSNSSANISQNQNTDSNVQGTTNNQALSNLSSTLMNQHHNSYSSSNLLNIPEHQDFNSNSDALPVVDQSSSYIPSNLVGSLNLPEQSYIPNTSSMNHPDQLFIPNNNTVNEHSPYNNIPTSGNLVNIHENSIFNNNDKTNNLSPSGSAGRSSAEILPDDKKRLTPSQQQLHQQQQTSRPSSTLAQSTIINDTTTQDPVEDDYCTKTTPLSTLHNTNPTPNSSSSHNNSNNINGEPEYYSQYNSYDNSHGPQFAYPQENFDAPPIIPMGYNNNNNDINININNINNNNIGDNNNFGNNNFSKWNMQRRASAPMIAFKKQQQKPSYLSRTASGNSNNMNNYSSSYGKDNSQIYNDYYPDERTINSYDYYKSNPSTSYTMTDQNQKQQPYGSRRVRYKSGPSESNPNLPITNAATGLFMFNNPSQSMSYQSLPELMNQNPYTTTFDMENPNIYHMNSSNSTSVIPHLNQNNPNSAFHYTYNVVLDPQQIPQQNMYYDPNYHEKFLSNYLFQKRHSVPTLHFMSKSSNLKSNNNSNNNDNDNDNDNNNSNNNNNSNSNSNNNSNNNNNNISNNDNNSISININNINNNNNNNNNNSNSNNYTNYNTQDFYNYSTKAPPTYLNNNNGSYEDMPMYGSGSKINKSKSFFSNKVMNNSRSHSGSSSAININGGGMNKYSNYYQNSSLSRSLTNTLDDPSSNASSSNLSSSNNSKKNYMDKGQKSNSSLNDSNFNYNNKNNNNNNNYYIRKRGSQSYHQHRKAKSMDNPNFHPSLKFDSNYNKNKNKPYNSILSEKEAFVSKDNKKFSYIHEDNIRYEDENDHMNDNEDDIVEVEVNYDDDYDDHSNENNN